MYKQGQVVELPKGKGRVVLLYTGSNPPYQHNFRDITPSSDSFGMQFILEDGTDFTEWAIGAVNELGVLKERQIRKLMENPKKAAGILKKIGYKN
jgi:hypothetical protein